MYCDCGRKLQHPFEHGEKMQTEQKGWISAPPGHPSFSCSVEFDFDIKLLNLSDFCHQEVTDFFVCYKLAVHVLVPWSYLI